MIDNFNDIVLQQKIMMDNCQLWLIDWLDNVLHRIGNISAI